MKIIEKFLTKNPCYTCGRTITPKGLMLHSVGCHQPSAMVFINQWNTLSNGRQVCVHGFIDGNTGDIYQTLPWNRRGWHAGGSANNTHIGVEMCEPSCIKYTSGSSFTCSDTAKAKAVAKRTYDAAVELFAYLCKQHKLDPLADGVIISHKEGHARGVASNHGDPEHLWKGLKLGYTMDGFRKDVKAAMGGTASTQEPAQKTIYRVQCGAYAVGDKVKCNAGVTKFSNGAKMAAWVPTATLYVRKIESGGKILLVSTEKTKAVYTGRVNASDVHKI